MDATMCTPQPRFVIVEAVYVVETSARVGPRLRKVTRHVSRTCGVRDVFYNGQRISGAPSTFQSIMGLLGLADLTSRANGQTRLLLAYAGMENLVTPLPPELHVPPLPGGLFREHTLPRVGPYVYGRDPIPNIRLFGRRRMQFTSQGGDGPPTAVAIYHARERRLQPVPPSMRRAALQQLLG